MPDVLEQVDSLTVSCRVSHQVAKDCLSLLTLQPSTMQPSNAQQPAT